MYGSIKPSKLTCRRDVRSEFGGHQYYNVVQNGKDEASDTDFYSLSDEEAASPPVYSVVKKKQVKAAEHRYLFIEAKIDNNLPAWLKTSSLNRCWKSPLMNKSDLTNDKPQEENIISTTNIDTPPPPPPRGKRGMAINKKPSWRLQYGSTSSSLESGRTTSQSMTPSPQVSKLPYKKSAIDSGSIRRPTNFDHHRIKSFANSIWKRTSNAFHVVSSSETMSSSEPCKTKTMYSSVPGKIQKEKNGETKPILSQLREDGNQSVKTNSYFGSNTSINSVWTEDGRLITPPPRRRSLSRQSLSDVENVRSSNLHPSSTFKECDRAHLSPSLSGDWKLNSSNNSNPSIQSNTSINRMLTSKGLLTPPERVRSKLRFGSSGQINQNVTPEPELQKPMLPRKCRSMNRISTASGIITPPPRRCFNHSTASLSNTFDNETKTKISGMARNQNNFDLITTSHSIDFCSHQDRSRLEQKSVQSQIERKPVVSFVSSKN